MGVPSYAGAYAENFLVVVSSTRKGYISKKERSEATNVLAPAKTSEERSDEPSRECETSKGEAAWPPGLEGLGPPRP